MIESLLEKFSYNPQTGEVVNKQTGKLLQPSWDGYAVVQLPIGKKKLKFNKLCVMLFLKKEVSKGHKILHLNLDERDTKARNMRVLPSEEFKIVKEALDNLDGGIKLTTHPKDSYSYIVTWSDNSLKKNKVIQDYIVARRFMTRLKLKYSKILTKYCIFDT
jgi:hypothetical protein